MKRHALFVGVNAYDDKTIRPLRFSIPDAAILADRFEGLGFRARLLPDPTAAQMTAAVEETVAGLGPGDVFLFFFSGHGFTSQDGAHLLFCRDDRERLLRINGAGTRVDALELLAAGPFHRAFLLDSCRSDALAGIADRGAAAGKDLDVIAIPPGEGSTFILRSCRRFLPSLEIDRFGHGLFTRGLLDAIDGRDARLAKCGSDFADGVASRMSARAAEAGVGARQVPSSTLEGPAFSLFEPGFAGTVSVAPALVVCPACGKKNRPEDTFRCRACGRDNLCLRHQDESTFLCSDCAAKARKGSSREDREVREETSCPVPGSAHSVTVAGVTFNLRWIPANGSRPAFWMGETLVTQQLWTAVMGNNPSKFKGGGLRPVEQVSWNDCRDFLAKLNAMDPVRKSGLAFRLPTEEEWERACLAGGRGGYCRLADGTEITAATLSRVARFGRTWNEGPAEVGTLEPNAWGLFDMHGNVCEWTLPTDGGLPAGRGGGWYHSAENCSASRGSRYAPGFASGFLGMRIAASFRSLPKTSDSTFVPGEP